MKKARSIAEYFINAFIEENFKHGVISISYDLPDGALITDAYGVKARLVYQDGTVYWEENS